MVLSRDDFEEWLEDHKDEAVARISGERMPLRTWLTMFAKGLVAESVEESDSDDVDEDDDEGDFDPLFDGEDD